MLKVERPDDLTEREGWAWDESIQHERNVTELQSYFTSWLERGNTSYVFENCLKIALKIEFYEQAIRNLRQPYYARKENQ